MLNLHFGWNFRSEYIVSVRLDTHTNMPAHTYAHNFTWQRVFA